MNNYKVWFDYEEEDFVVVCAKTPEDAKVQVMNKLASEHGWDQNDEMLDSLNALTTTEAL